MNSHFEVAAGSMLGRDHLCDGNLTIGKNNQDAYDLRQNAGVSVVIVADGCGSKSRSEAGAIIGSKLTAKALVEQWHRHSNLARTSGFDTALPQVLEAARQDVLAQLRILCVNSYITGPKRCTSTSSSLS